MNREPIIQMARDAGLGDMKQYWFPALERFAAAIRAATKDEDAKICGEYGKKFKNEASMNDGRQSDIAFGRMCASADIGEAIRASK